MKRHDFDGPRVAVSKPAHRYAWLWESLEADATFELRAMFGAKAAYLDGKLQLWFFAKAEPWRGVLVCTDRQFHEALKAEFPALSSHPVLPKWLYLPEAEDDFERIAQRLVTLAARRDARIGVEGSPRRKTGPPARAKG